MKIIFLERWFMLRQEFAQFPSHGDAPHILSLYFICFRLFFS